MKHLPTTRRAFLAAAGAGASGLWLSPSAADPQEPLPGPPPWWLAKPMRLLQTNLREIDAALDIDVYLRRVLELGADVVLFNVGGIVCNYPTDLPFHYRNPNLRDDLVGKAVQRLHAEGIRVIGRFDFSKINETLAAQKPEWLYRSVKGETVNYNGQVHTCINGGYQQEYMFEILGEALHRYPLDGVFFNMIGYVTRDYSGNNHGLCQCENCRQRFRKDCGLDLPSNEQGDGAVLTRYRRFKSETSDELFHRVSRFVRSRRQDVAVCTYTAAGVDIIRKESNSALDRPLPEWNYSASDNVKSALGSYRDKAVSNAAVHFVDFAYRHSAVSPHLTELRLAENLACGGWLDYYCIGPVERQEDRRTLDVVRDLFQFQRKQLRWLTDTRSVAEVCLVKSGGDEYRGLFRILAENQVLFDVIQAEALADDTPRPLDDYQAVVLPDAGRLDEAARTRLDRYVQGGGKILATGAAGPALEQGRAPLEALGVVRIDQRLGRERGSYLRIRDEDRRRLREPDLAALNLVYLDSPLLACQAGPRTVGLLRYIPCGMYGPPEKCYYGEVSDIPALFHSSYGRGSAVWLPWEIGRQYQDRSHHGHALLIKASLNTLLNLSHGLQLDAGPLVEATRRESLDQSFEWVGLVNHSGQLGTAFHPPAPLHDITLRIRTQRIAKSVRALRRGQRLASKADGQWIACTLPRLERYEIVLLEYA